MPVLLPSWTNVELFVKMNKVEVKRIVQGSCPSIGAVSRDACATPFDCPVYGFPVGGVL
jgi:hypothetical protein